MKRAVALLVVMSFVSMGCYNTYVIPRGELEKLQASESESTTVKDVQGRDVVVKDDTRLFVRSKGGKPYPITPFNFKITESQLVASDRDYILELNGLKEEAEVDHVSTWKTALLISLGVAALGGLVTYAAIEGGSKSSGQ